MKIIDSAPQTHLLDPTRLTVSAHPANPYEELANAIIIQAAKDYRAALRGRGYSGKTPYGVIKDCEKFFKSEWFTILSKVNGTMLMNKLRKEYQDEC